MRIMLFVVLFFISLVSIAAPASSSTPATASENPKQKPYRPSKLYHPEVGSIDMIGLKALMLSHADIVIVDTNIDEWFTGIIIPGAIRLNEDSSNELILKTIPDKEKVIITYCGSYECPASKKFAKRLIKLGYENVLHYPGGIEEWYNAGNQIDKLPVKSKR